MKIKVISLFEKWQLGHEYFANKADAVNELWILLLSAREQYVRNVRKQGCSYSCFAESFIKRHKHVACDEAMCKNVHEENLSLVGKLLMEKAELAIGILQRPSFTLEDCQIVRKMIASEDTSPHIPQGRKSKTNRVTSISFNCSFTESQLQCIADCANRNRMFCGPSVSRENMAAFFSCNPGFCLVAGHIRKVAVMLDALQSMEMLCWDWKNTIECGRLLLSKNDRKPITASNLSTALSAAKKHPTSYVDCIQLNMAKLPLTPTTDKKEKK